MSAVRAAVESAFRFHAVPNYLAAAMLAYGSKRVNSALETVKDVRMPSRHHFKGLVVIVSANFASRHFITPYKSSHKRQGEVFR